LRRLSPTTSVVAEGGQRQLGVARRSSSLDGMRGLGIMAVLVFHAGVGLPGAFLAVSMFFTLSGFLITALLLSEHERRGRVSLNAFWARRFRRLLPAALAAVALGAVLVWRSDNAVWAGSFRADGLAALGYVANWRFVFSAQAYEAVFASPSPVQHFWSLAIEEQVYLALPPLTVLVLRLAGGSRRVLGGVFATLFIASAAVPTVFGLSGDRVYLGTDTRAAEVLAGALLAVVLSSSPRLADGATFPPTPQPTRLRAIGALATVAMLGLWVVTPRTATWVSQGGLALYALLSCVVIVAALAPATRLARLLSVRPLAALGLISYGVYLYHWPIYLWLLPRTTSWMPWQQLAVGATASVVLGVLSYRYLEQPFRRRTVPALRGGGDAGSLRAWRPWSSTRPSPFILGAAVSVLVVSAVVVAVTATTAPTSRAVANDVLSRPPGALVATINEPPPGARSAPAPRPMAPNDATVTTSTTGTRAVLAPPPIKALRVPNRPLRLLVLGDSSAVMLLSGLNAWGGSTHVWEVSNYARIGCGIGRGGSRMVGDKPEAIPADCDDFAAAWPPILARTQPDLVMIADAFWDSTDRRLAPGEPWRGPGDPAYDEYLQGELSAATDVAGSSGAAVVWLDNAPLEFGRDLIPPRTDLAVNDPARQERFNALLDRVAATRPFVRVLPYARFMATWPDGPFALRVDGLHVDDTTAPAVLAWLGPEMVDAYWQIKRPAGAAGG
jgi:peptidoglycan/LPS O-acetylase OafA/YrhL